MVIYIDKRGLGKDLHYGPVERQYGRTLGASISYLLMDFKHLRTMIWNPLSAVMRDDYGIRRYGIISVGPPDMFEMLVTRCH